MTSAAAMVLDTPKVVESKTLTEPPASFVVFDCDHAKLNGVETVPLGLLGWSCAIEGVGEGPGKMYSCVAGILAKSEMAAWKFFARTSLGTWATQSVRRNVSSSLKSPESKT